LHRDKPREDPWLAPVLEYASGTVIGQETIDRVREHTSIVALVGESVKLQKKGRSHVGLCPFHKEKTGSFYVTEERARYHCFGCGVDGDAFRFVMEVEGLSFAEAVRRLAERAGITVVETASESDRRQEADARRRQDELYAANAAAAEYFERMLREHPLAGHAKRELGKRGLDSDNPTDEISDALQAFRIGYAPYGWDGLARHLLDAGLSHRVAEQVGLLVPRKSGGGHYDRFRHRLMFAVIDQQGRVIAFSGRALEAPSDAELVTHRLEKMGSSTPGDAPAKYVNSPESPVYKKREALFGLYQARAAIRDAGHAVMVEGNFDVVSLHAHGIKHVVAPLGTAFTSEQARLLKRFAPAVTLLFDGDAAGKRAALASREPCKGAGLLARVASLPDGTDPDAWVREHGAEAIRRVVGASRGLLDYVIDEHFDGFDPRDARACAARLNEIAEIVAAEEDPTVRALGFQHADRVVQRLGVADAGTFEALRRGMARKANSAASGASPPQRQAAPPERARSESSRQRVELEILGALLDYPELVDTEEVRVGVDLMEGDVAAAIAALRQAVQGTTLQNPELVLAKLAPSIHPFASARHAAPRHEQVADAQAELRDNIQKLKRLELRRQKTEVVNELERAASVGDLDQEVALLKEHWRRARERHGLE
jgi:DNA primase